MIISRRWHYELPGLILCLAFSLRLYHLDFQSIWWDEGHSIFVASHPISQIPTLPAMDVHPPAYFTLLHLWIALTGQSEFTLRYLSVIFSLLTVALLWRFARSISHPYAPSSNFPIAPLLVSLLAALSPMYIAYAQEVRSYAMITFLALTSTFALWQILFRRTPNLGWLLLYVLFTTACLYTHYFTVFLLLFQNLAWLVWVLWPSANRGHRDANSSISEPNIRWNPEKLMGTPKPKFLRIPTSSSLQASRFSRLTLWIASQVGILLLFTPQLRLALRQVTSYTNPNLISPTLAHFISRSGQAYTIGLTMDPGPTQWAVWAIAGMLAIVLLIQLYLALSISNIKFLAFHSWVFKFSPLPRKFLIFLFLIVWFLLPLAAYFVVLQRQPSFEPRYMMLVTPALFLLLALSLAPPAPPLHITHHKSPIIHYALPFTSLIPLIIFIIALQSYYTNETFFKDDSASVADWLAAETTANDIVYVDVPHPFHYYAEKDHILAPIRYLFVDIHTAADTLTQEAAGRDRLYWVTWRGSDTDPRGVIPFLTEKFGRKLGQYDFRGYRVEWFDLSNQGGVFSLPAILTPLKATFGDTVRLDGIAYGEVTAVDNPTWATLHFTLLRETDINYKVSLRLRSAADKRVVSQVDKDLLNDRHFRTSAWPLADPALNQAINIYTLPLAPDTAPGTYQLEVIVYNAQPPYPSEGVTGHGNIDGIAALVGHITVIP